MSTSNNNGGSDTADKLDIPKNFTLQDTGLFKIIDDSYMIKKQQLKIESYFKENSSKSGKIRLSKRGTGTYHSDPHFPVVDAYFNSKYDIWWSDKIDPTFKKDVQTQEEFENPKAFKNVFGIGEPNWKPNNKNSRAITEINYNKDGTDSTAGFILEKNGIYYLGITKTIGGNYDTSKAGLDTDKGKMETYFSENNTPIIESPKPIFLIAKIDENFVEQVSTFIKNIKKIKDYLIDHDLPKIDKSFQTIEPTYYFDEQYEKESMRGVAELENLKYSKTDLDQEIERIVAEIESNPKKHDVVTSRYGRSTKLSDLLKIKFKHTCQVCEKTTFKNKANHFYTESHHIVPLSMSPKSREDTPENILIVCANCHRKFDKGNEDTLIETYEELQKKHLLSTSLLEKLKECNAISQIMYNKLILK